MLDSWKFNVTMVVIVFFAVVAIVSRFHVVYGKFNVVMILEVLIGQSCEKSCECL